MIVALKYGVWYDGKKEIVVKLHFQVRFVNVVDFPVMTAKAFAAKFHVKYVLDKVFW